MSYGVFLILFVCLPLVGLIFVLRGSLRRVHLTMLIGMATIAMVYTTPWDNYLVATRVWYYNPDLILSIKVGDRMIGAVLGYVPIEEYLFFVLQSLLTGLIVFWLWRRFYPADFAEKSGY